jgi:hypothetical protein
MLQHRGLNETVIGESALSGVSRRQELRWPASRGMPGSWEVWVPVRL